MVYQHFTLMPSMSVAENLLLATTTIPFRIDWRRERETLERMLADMPFRVPLGAQVSALSAGEKQKVEILKQLYLGHRLLILDEPTSVLTPQEADEVLGLLRGMARAGRVTVVMITHKFREVLSFADDVTVLRHGRKVCEGPVKTLTAAILAEQMIGSVPAPQSIARSTATARGCRLEIQDLTVLGDADVAAIRGLSLSVEGGTILGVAGVSGNGQRELVETLSGQRDAETGRIRVHGAPFQPTRAAMTRLGVACLPDEPAQNACVAEMSALENLALRRYDRAPLAGQRGFWLKPAAMRRHAEAAIKRYGIKVGSLSSPVTSLSGGQCPAPRPRA